MRGSRLSDVDFPVLLERLSDAGVSLKEVAKVVGIPYTNLAKIKQEYHLIPEQWQQACALLDLYFRHVPTQTLPMYWEPKE